MAEKKITRNRETAYSNEEVEQSLLVLAHYNGNATRAVRDLKKQGIEVSRRTVSRWRSDMFPDRYAQIRRDVIPSIREEQAERLRASVDRLSGLEDNLIGRNLAAVSKLKPSEASTALRNASVSKEINIDKAQAAEEAGLPRQPPRSLEEDLAFLRRVLTREQKEQLLGISAADAIDATATEEPVSDAIPPKMIERNEG